MNAPIPGASPPGTIVVEGLTRAFDGRTVVEDVSFSVPQGSLVALLGPNGAGKTTTVRMLMGLIAPTRGRAVVAGHEVAPTPADRAALRAACGLLTETPGFYDRLSGWDNLMFFGRLYRLPERRLADALERFVREMQLWDARERLVATYSKGMKQRLALIRALLHEPRVLFLDEPTSGLDPEASVAVRDLIQSLKGQGRTIVLCTHNLDEATRLADIVGILKQRLIRFESLATMRSASGGAARIHVSLSAPWAGTLPAAMEGITRVDHGDPLSIDLWVDDARARAPALVRALVERGAQIAEVRREEPTLEALYLETVRGQA
jgi:ABC-2 type transport system ATP-binding protein